MAKVKEIINVMGHELTAHENAIYKVLCDNAKAMSYADVMQAMGVGEDAKKSIIATLARLEKTHGLLKKNEPIKVTTYEIAENIESE